MEEKGAFKTCPQCGYEEDAAPESLLHLTPGTILQDKYLIGRVLGQGGFGITYLAWDNLLKIKLAIKEYLPQQLATRSAGQNTVTVYKSSLAEEFSYGLTKFLDEARTLARFNEHPNIVTVRDYFEVNDTAYLVMNYHEGVTLQSYLDSKGGKISVEQALKIFMPVLDALKEVHAAGILHRDISPDNLLIDKTGRVILIDFGAARQAMGDKSKSLSVIMKAGYSPPEQYQSRGKQGPWTDIYAVAASFYRSITGVAPAEAFDRVMEDNLDMPTVLGIKIDKKIEETLLKALAVNAKERYQAVEQFQKELVASLTIGQVSEGYAGERQKEEAGPDKYDNKSAEADIRQKAKVGPLANSVIKSIKKPLPDQQPVDRGSKQETPYTISRKTVKIAALVAACSLLIFGAFNLFGGDGTVTGPGGSVSQEVAQKYYPAVIATFDADYYIDYENGTIPLGDLPIGARVVDPSWEWEFRIGDNYSGKGAVKPVTWIVVAKDHYNNHVPHVTLLSEEQIGKHPFDNSTNRGSQNGSNHWDDSGTADASRGLRPWLNSTGIHASEGFYRAFSENFKGAILATTLPNKVWKNGSTYSTQDRVFIPSTTELGDIGHRNTYLIGKVYPYFRGEDNAKRVSLLFGEARWYWTRSPGSDYIGGVRSVHGDGEFSNSGGAESSTVGVRPALNLKADTLVSEIRN
jgi:serine/threonine protein kinase